MIIVTTALGALAVAGIVGTVVEVFRDGLRRTPTRSV